MLVIGTNKTDTILEHLPESYLLIDDGAVIDALALPKRRKVTRLNFSHHSFNPLTGMDYYKARQLIAIFGAVFPEGANTLTKKNSDYALLKALLRNKTRTLDTLIAPSKDPTQQDAYQKIDTLLLSPILRRVLCNPTNFSMRGIVIARLDRAMMDDFDCFVLGNLLISAYPGPVVIPDFGFYAIPHHIQLIRQNRLVAGLNVLDEVPAAIRQQLLLMHPKLGHRCTFDDAEILAQYAGIPRGTNAHTDFIAAAMR